MEKRSLKNPENEQERYERATRHLMKAFTKLFVAAIVTISLLACGIYFYHLINKTAGIILMAASVIGFVSFIWFFRGIHQYILKHEQ